MSKEIHFSSNLRFLRKREGLSMRKLAELTGLSGTSIANYEKDTSPVMEAIVSLSAYFKVSIDDMILKDLRQNEFSENVVEYNAKNMEQVINDKTEIINLLKDKISLLEEKIQRYENKEKDKQEDREQQRNAG